jgi:hypothetical protein
MKHAKNVNVSATLDEVCYAVMTVHEYSHMARRGFVAITDLRVLDQDLCPLKNTHNNTLSSIGILCLDELKNILELALRLNCPV